MRLKDEHFCRVIRRVPSRNSVERYSSGVVHLSRDSNSCRWLAARHRLEEARLTAVEQRIEAELGLGRHAELIELLPTLVGQNPYRERLCAHLMLALYRCGRQVEALAFYLDARQILVGELGMEPSRELQLLQERMLVHYPGLDAPVRLERTPQVGIRQQPVDSTVGW